MLDQLLGLDKTIFLALNSSGASSFWDAFWMIYTKSIHWIPFYAFLAFLMFKKSNTKMFVLTLVVIALMIAFTDQITNVFKNGFQRPRPCYSEDLKGLMILVKSWCGSPFGYFSGHSSNSIAIAVFSGLVLRYKYKYAIYGLIVWAIFMGYSRIYIGVHYPLDVLSGFIFGCFSGYLFYELNNYLQSRFTLVGK
jgi:undecaprenyl-diphosphatase